MRTAIIPPKHPRLREYVQYFWTLSAKQDDAPCSIIGPEAYFDLILSFAAATVWKNQQQQRFALRGSFLSGMRTEPFEVEAQGNVEYLAIRFYPHRFAHLAGTPLAEITSLHAVELDDLPQKTWTELTEKLADFFQMSERIAALEKELLVILDRQTPARSWLIERALSSIHESQGTLPIRRISAALDVYPKRLEREFETHLGVTPKWYSRIVRFSHALNYIQRPSSVDWGEVVYQLGYCDQSHFIKECVEFLGRSPEQCRQLALNTQ